MRVTQTDNLSDEIKKIKIYTENPVLLHLYTWPFILLYSSWIYCYWLSDTLVDVLPEIPVSNDPEQQLPDLGFVGIAFIAFIQLLFGLFCYWSVRFRVICTCSGALFGNGITDLEACYGAGNNITVHVIPHQNHGLETVVPIRRASNPASPGGILLYFIHRKVRYEFDPEKGIFAPPVLPDNEPFSHYTNHKGFQTESDVLAVRNIFGPNILDMDIPEFMELFIERATAPFFVFQVFSVLLWTLDEYVYYSLMTLGMLVTFEVMVVKQQQANMRQIRAMGNKPYKIQAYRFGKWRQVSSEELLPGDIVSVTRSVSDKLVPCDIVLLRGSCIIDESLLTGESTPVMKEPLEQTSNENSATSSEVFDAETHSKLHLLSSGTRVVQTSPPPKSGPGMKAPDNGCIGYVVRTGFSTSQGKLLKTILTGVKQVTANNKETFFFILFLLIFAIAASAYVWTEGVKDSLRSRYKLVLECILILTSVVPPELPLELSLAVNTSLIALMKLQMFCTEPFRIPFAGKVDVCCFDKTGTLTSDSLRIDGIAGVGEKRDAPGLELETTLGNCPLPTLQVLTGCQSLVILDDASSMDDHKASVLLGPDGQPLPSGHAYVNLIGDPLEKAVLQAAGWTLTRSDCVIPPKSAGKGVHGLKIFHRFHFSSALKRMLVIAGHTPDSVPTTTSYFALLKGAPEVVKGMISPDDLPDFYDDVYLRHARAGSRVLALAYKSLGSSPGASGTQMGSLSRTEIINNRSLVEKDMLFAGFLVVSCPLKSDTYKCVRELAKASHHLVMITGDNPLTACHVAQKLKFSHPHHTTKPLLILTRRQSFGSDTDEDEDSKWRWLSVDEKINLSTDEILAAPGKNRYCMTGDALAYLSVHPLLAKKLLPKILTKIRVYARVSPSQKQQVINLLTDAGFTTLMCGDGTNDVAALKQAHVGIALLSKPAPPPKKPVQDPTTSAPSMTDRLPPARSNFQKKMQDMVKQMEEEQKRSDASQLVQLGDASIAAPFTSKNSSVNAVCETIRQGRCTLVTTLQMFKILAINALILAYSQSVLYLQGIRFSDAQATLQGLLLAGCFLFISRAVPAPSLSSQRPLPNIFNFYTIVTVLCQFFIHLFTLISLSQATQPYNPVGNFVPENATDLMSNLTTNDSSLIMSTTPAPPLVSIDDDGFEVVEDPSFSSSVVPTNEPKLHYAVEEGSALAANNVTAPYKDPLDRKFSPTPLNSIVYLVSVFTQVVTFAINYKGQPFMMPLSANKPLIYSMLITSSIVLAMATYSAPELNEYFQIVELPENIRQLAVITFAGDLLGCFLTDRFLQFCFGYGSLRDNS